MEGDADVVSLLRTRIVTGSPNGQLIAGTPIQPTVSMTHFRPTTKEAAVIGMRKSTMAASLAHLTTSTGWLPRTARAALSGLRKRGLIVDHDKIDGVALTTTGAA